MDDHARPASQRISDQTLEIASPALSDSCGPHCKVNLVEGTGPGLTGEVCNVLRYRLRAAALLLTAGLGAFLIYGLFLPRIEQPEQQGQAIMHLIATLGCAYAAFRLCGRCQFSHFKLRAFEYAIFGLVGVFFVIAFYTGTEKAIADGIVPHKNPFQLLLYTYALLIPNTLRRAMPMILAFAYAPLVITLIVWGIDIAFAADANVSTYLSHHASYLIETLLISSINCGVALVGVYSINQLRTEAFEARQLGQYRLKQLIGSGGMGEVYLAEHRLMKRPCAIKIIRPDKAGDPLTLARFEREVRTIAKLSHWNNIDIYDYGRTEDGTFYHVMEFLPGLNLNDLVKRFGPMPAERVIYLMRQACDALSEAHKLGLVHRDIKPANIFSAIRGGLYDVTKVLDFGLAKPISSHEEDTGLTQEGLITGSPLYMSPEQATGDSEPDARSDIYSLGAVMYFMLTGRPPFDFEKPMKVIVAHAHETPAPVSSLVNVPADVEAIVMRSLEKSPEDRFQDAEHLMLALEGSSVARGWNRTKAAAWWNDATAEGTYEPESTATDAELSATMASAVTRA